MLEGMCMTSTTHILRWKIQEISTSHLNNLKIDDEEEQTFEINLQHFYDVLEATRLRITEGIEDERLCTVSEACADVHDIQTFYSQFKMTDKPKGTEQPLFLKGTF